MLKEMNAQIKTIPPGQLSDMQEVALSLLVLLAGLPALDANDPEDKNSPFYYDRFSLPNSTLDLCRLLCRDWKVSAGAGGLSVLSTAVSHIRGA
ncbi:FXYD domain-containing ion transport regulator 3 isoform X5 [Orcinus orca]|uniref:FXYD domain-containing ion transport regulator 3 isoform X5 n=1 Tax=Orcinus orca TaxID=9733 RepID=UPI0014410838|nr:FXYD domain-containing ion transport regulator 3 isoform X5 [Orcinus orca]